MEVLGAKISSYDKICRFDFKHSKKYIKYKWINGCKSSINAVAC